MGQRIYLKIDGVEGSGTADRRGWMELTNASQALSTHDGREASAWHDVSISRICDRATPLLARAAAVGRRFPEAVLEITDGAEAVRLRLTFRDLALRNWSLSAVRENPEPAPYENFSLAAAAVEWTWNPGSAAPVRAAFEPGAER